VSAIDRELEVLARRLVRPLAVSAGEAAALVGVSESQIRRWVDQVLLASGCPHRRVVPSAVPE
jgi:hypothetical protein